jgi:hypothetical protein
MDLHIFTAIAYASIAILIASFAIYLSIKLLGKISKFAITTIAIGFVLWFLFSDHSFIQMTSGLGDILPSFVEIFGKGA